MNDIIGRIDDLVRRAEAIPDAGARAISIDLVRAVMDFHAEALGRMMETLTITSSPAIGALVEDEIVSAALALHGIHPEDTETRVRRAMRKLAAYFDPRGCDVTLVEAMPQRVIIRFRGRPGSGSIARRLIEDAISEAAPELEEIVVEGIATDRADSGFVPLSALAAAEQT